MGVSCDKEREDECLDYTTTEVQAYEMLLTYIKTDLLRKPRIVKMAELYKLFTLSINSQGENEVKESTRTHFRRKLGRDFKDRLDFEDLFENNKIFVIPRNPFRLDLAKLAIEKNSTTSSLSRTD